MSSPWLTIPLVDYEGHMQSIEVQQLDALADLFAIALAQCQPASVAVLGIAGGNGLDRIDAEITKRVVGVDVHAGYLDEVRRRQGAHYALELHCVDLARQPAGFDPVALVHAALIFEHAGVDLALKSALSLVGPGGGLSVVLQLPSEASPGVSASPFPALQRLKAGFSLVEPQWLVATVAARGLRLVREVHHPLPSGKAFWLGIFTHLAD